ncbi:hypothetical protein RB195_010888 [Necator americanus]|uniref:Origin recognition complex subunit 3 N-terminal domain-containing protein n=2 Tax=Necator americanus TaxID=51031 RepID=A0ABR1D1M7_NECAM
MRVIASSDDINPPIKRPTFLRSKEIASLESFNPVIDRKVNQLFDDVLNEIVDFFLSATTKRENVFDVRRETKKLKTAIVQCNFGDVNRLMKGVLVGLNREIGRHVLVRSGHTDLYEVIEEFEDCSSKKKQLLFIEQAESLSPQFLNGLFYSLATLGCDILVLLCISTKPIMFTSRVSRRCLALLHTKRFYFSLSPEVFHSLISDTLLNPSFTNLRLQPGFLRFLRSAFLGNVFSISILKKCIRIALLQHFWTNRSPDPSSDVSRSFVDSVDTYMDVLKFLHGNLYASRDDGEGQSVFHFIKLHEDIQLGGFDRIRSSCKYRDWTHSITLMSEDDIGKLLDQEGISSFDIKLNVSNQNSAADRREATAEQLVSSLSEKTSILELKSKMKEIALSRQRNSRTLARKKLISDIENVFRSVLLPFTSIPHSNLFLFGDKTMHSLAPNIISDIERSLLVCPAMNEHSSLNVAIRTLVDHGLWKTVPLTGWRKLFVTSMMKHGFETDKKKLDSIFFACVGQLEHMGIIKASVNTRVDSVTVLYHVLSCVV